MLLRVMGSAWGHIRGRALSVTLQPKIPDPIIRHRETNWDSLTKTQLVHVQLVLELNEHQLASDN